MKNIITLIIAAFVFCGCLPSSSSPKFEPGSLHNVNFCDNIRLQDMTQAKVCGSARFALPSDTSGIWMIEQRYKDTNELKSRALEVSVERALYSTGTLFRTKKDLLDKRGLFMIYLKDQIENGSYDIIFNENGSFKLNTYSSGEIIHMDTSPLSDLDINIYSIAIKEIK